MHGRTIPFFLKDWVTSINALFSDCTLTQSKPALNHLDSISSNQVIDGVKVSVQLYGKRICLCGGVGYGERKSRLDVLPGLVEASGGKAARIPKQQPWRTKSTKCRTQCTLVMDDEP